jgi:hypothetical protein
VAGYLFAKGAVMRIKNRLIAGVVFATALLASAAIPLSGAQATTVFSDNFNSDAQGLNTTPLGWNLTQGSVDIIGSPGPFNYLPTDIGNYIDLNGSTFQYGGIGTAPPTFGAGTYTLTFDLAGNQVGPNYGDSAPKTTDISLGNWNTTLTLNYNDPLTTHSYTFTTTGGSIIFSMEPGGNANIGNLLDNVTLSTVSTPLPSTWTMLIAGFVGLGFLAFRGTKKGVVAIAAA